MANSKSLMKKLKVQYNKRTQKPSRSLWNCLKRDAEDDDSERDATPTENSSIEAVNNWLLSNQVSLLKDLMKRTCHINSAKVYLEHVFDTVEQLKAAGFDLDDKWLVNIILTSLDNHFDPMIEEIETLKIKLTSALLKYKILEYANKQINVNFKTESQSCSSNSIFSNESFRGDELADRIIGRFPSLPPTPPPRTDSERPLLQWPPPPPYLSAPPTPPRNYSVIPRQLTAASRAKMQSTAARPAYPAPSPHSKKSVDRSSMILKNTPYREYKPIATGQNLTNSISYDGNNVFYGTSTSHNANNTSSWHININITNSSVEGSVSQGYPKTSILTSPAPPVPPKSFDDTVTSLSNLSLSHAQLQQPQTMRKRLRPPPPPPPFYKVQTQPTGQSLYSDKAQTQNKDLGSEDIAELRKQCSSDEFPLIAALCTDKNLLRQTRAKEFILPKHSSQVSPLSAPKSNAKNVISSRSSSSSRHKYPVSGIVVPNIYPSKNYI